MTLPVRLLKWWRGLGKERATSIVCFASVLVLGVILMAGLWPFRPPTNQVRWVESQPGLEFGRYGTVVSAGLFRSGDVPTTTGTIEIWLRPSGTRNRGTILSFDQSDHPGMPLSLEERADAIGIRRNNVDPQNVSHTALFYAGGVFHPDQPVFIAVSLEERGVSVYVNGTLAQAFSHSRAWNDLTGRLVLANAPASNDTWSGQILGLAIQRQGLTPSQILADHKNWLTTRRPINVGGDGAALYLFDERRGARVENKLDPSTGLDIADNFFILHPAFLELPWNEYRPTRGYWQDVALNVAGFVPWGLCVFFFLSLRSLSKYPVAVTVGAGVAVSLTLEVLQGALPTRNSSTTDLITNTLGTVIGILICKSTLVQMLLAEADRPFNGAERPQVMDPSAATRVSV